MKRKSKAKKWPLFTAIGVASVLVVGASAILLFRQPNQATTKEETAKIVLAKEGSVASSVLLIEERQPLPLQELRQHR